MVLKLHGEGVNNTLHANKSFELTHQRKVLSDKGLQGYSVYTK